MSGLASLGKLCAGAVLAPGSFFYFTTYQVHELGENWPPPVDQDYLMSERFQKLQTDQVGKTKKKSSKKKINDKLHTDQVIYISTHEGNQT